jgi:hypothetical protein
MVARAGDRNVVTEAPPTTDVGQAYWEVVPHRRSLLRHATTPVVVLLALGALYLYVSGKQLDSIEQRRLNWDFISASTLRHVEIAVIATVVVALLAVPTGILLTRGFSGSSRCSRSSGPSGCAPRSSPWSPTRSCRSCATPWSGCSRSTRRSSRRAAAWA